MVKNGCGFDVASENEMKSVIQRGVDKSKLVYANPTRPMGHLKYAREHEARDPSSNPVTKIMTHRSKCPQIPEKSIYWFLITRMSY